VEPVVTGLTLQVGHLVSLDAKDRVANRARLDALEFLVHILFPQEERIQDTAILIVQHEHDLQGPPPPSVLGNANRFLAVDFDISKWERWRHSDGDTQLALVLLVRRNDLAADTASTNCHFAERSSLLDSSKFSLQGRGRYNILDERAQPLTQESSAIVIVPCFDQGGEGFDGPEYYQCSKLANGEIILAVLVDTEAGKNIVVAADAQVCLLQRQIHHASQSVGFLNERADV